MKYMSMEIKSKYEWNHKLSQLISVYVTLITPIPPFGKRYLLNLIKQFRFTLPIGFTSKIFKFSFNN